MAKRRKRKKTKALQPSAVATKGADRSPGSSGGRRGSTTEGEDEPETERTAFDVFRENAEALIIAVVLAIIIRHFAVEAFEIPTGSMAPTLFGMHVELECPNCSHEYEVAVQSDSSTGKLRSSFPERIVYEGHCPNPNCTLALHAGSYDRPVRREGEDVRCQSCGTEFRGVGEAYQRTQATVTPVRCPICHHRYQAVIKKGSHGGGHKILVNKFAFALGKPQRWDVIVFEFDQWKNYIKRLIGLPGEKLQIFDGDIYTNGKLERKPPYVQEEMWRRISDSDQEERGLNRTPAWREVGAGGSGRWTHPGLRWSVTNRQEVPAALEYSRGFDNYISYNAFNVGLPPLSRTEGQPAGVQVGDRKVAFTAYPLSAGAKGWVGAQIRDGDFTFRLQLPVGEPSEARPAVLERVENEADPSRPDLSPKPFPGPEWRVTHPVALPRGEPSRVAMENVDDRVTVRINGDTVFVLEYESCDVDNPPPQANGKLPQHLRLLGTDVHVEIKSLRVYIDFYYINWDLDAGFSRAEDWGGIQLAEGEYVALGDNSPSSSDGRKWGHVPENNLMGKAILIFWPPGDWDFIR